MSERECEGVLPGAVCVDPECVYCRIAVAEQPNTVFKVSMLTGPVLTDPLNNRRIVGKLRFEP